MLLNLSSLVIVITIPFLEKSMSKKSVSKNVILYWKSAEILDIGGLEVSKVSILQSRDFETENLSRLTRVSSLVVNTSKGYDGYHIT